MNRSTVASRWNLELIEANHQRWLRDPASVDETWRVFFEGYDLGLDASPASNFSEGGDAPLAAARAQVAVTRLIDAYREMGHMLADLDPLGMTRPSATHELLELSEFGLDDSDLDKTFFSRLTDPPTTTLRELLAILRDTYCRTIGVEYMHIRDNRIRHWLQERMEPTRNHPNLDLRQKRRILWKLNAAELFETFLDAHYVGQKRFSLEGGEMLIPLLDAIIERVGKHGAREIVLGMPHRGRLNVLANTLNKPYGMIFSEFEGGTAEVVGGDGDVKYHLGFSADHVTADKHTIHLSLTPNPSHLEAVDPVVAGRTRAKQRRFQDRDKRLGLPILIHGDAAFSGQGLVAETLNLSQLPGYGVGGTIHVVVNNQIGFTTSPRDARSTRYCTDVAKMIEAPIFHVNGEDPEAVVYVGELALDFRETFGRDVVIDMVCYRKHGHNEGDEPSFTQPLMYSKIRGRDGIRKIYNDRLIASGELSVEESATLTETFNEMMEENYKEVHERKQAPPPQPGFNGLWKGLSPRYSFEPVDTGITREAIAHIAEKTNEFPEGFHLHPKMERILAARKKAMLEGPVDWATAEALSFGGLLLEGTPVRLSGQDCRRGTFSQRHSVLVCAETGTPFVPLNNLAPHQAEYTVYDSMLSEAAVLGFEYGYSLDAPRMLILWEAQFGDFANGAQVIIDQFIASAESKWGRSSGLVMLLPHGYEGQGPEHSSARLERFLQLCAEDNIQVAAPSSPAQYFHLLRRQVRREFRKPLVVMTPKSLLRHKLAVSTPEELTVGSFREVIDDQVDPEGVRRVVLCAGKVYYDLIAQREKVAKTRDVAIVRVEQFYPWPQDALAAVVGRYKSAREWVWAQEESQNMGAWTFMAPRLHQLAGTHFEYVGRDASASPATGSHAVHDREQTELVEAAVGAPELPYFVSAQPSRSSAGKSAALKQGVV
ncbi:MAG: 2-oxoglutarate dehydrogenase E1 component [Planctomycetota bacterium]|nr:2-oxoglutarate dehydrogenase E1 component [Planctomycetota bacterium]